MYTTKYDADNKLWSGNDFVPLFHPTVYDSPWLQISPGKDVVGIKDICDISGERTTYNEMWLKTVRAAQNLQKLGLSKPDILGFSAIDRSVAPVIYAAFCLGCPVRLVSPVYIKADMIHVLSVSKPKLMFCNVERYDFMLECLQATGNEAKIFTFGGTIGGSIAAESLFVETGVEGQFLPVLVNGANKIAALICSSGTTAPCKTMALSHLSIVEDCNNIGLLNAGDIHYCPGSFYLISGLYMNILGVIHGATNVITSKDFTAELQLKLVERRIASGAPAEINKYLPNDKMYSGYGQTELSLLITGTFHETVEDDHAGKLVNGAIVKIVDIRCDFDINPSEIESHLIKSPDIDYVCAVGIPNREEEYLSAAAVVRTKNVTITERDVYEMVANNFDAYKHLRGGVYFFDTFPATIGGKYMRKAITDAVIEMSKG